MNTLTYKGYTGSVEYSTEENYFFGRVQGLHNNCITYEGDTVEELKADFEAGVDDYLDACIEYKVEPEKTNLWYLSLCFPLDLQPRIVSVAKANGESVNAFITRIARREVENASM